MWRKQRIKWNGVATATANIQSTAPSSQQRQFQSRPSNDETTDHHDNTTLVPTLYRRPKGQAVYRKRPVRFLLFVLLLLLLPLLTFLYSQRAVLRRMYRRHVRRRELLALQARMKVAHPITARHLQQMAAAYQEMVEHWQQLQSEQSFNTSQSTKVNENSTTTTIPVVPFLDRSFLSRPPLLVTHPTTVQSSIPNTRTSLSSQQSCTLQTTPRHNWTMARIVVFQRNGAKQLQSFLTHYLHALPADALVVIDHESDASSYTRQSLLPYYAQLGIHIWHCTGDYETGRSSMWSMVASVYQADSAYVFPLDVDELVAVMVDDQTVESVDASSAAAATTAPSRRRNQSLLFPLPIRNDTGRSNMHHHQQRRRRHGRRPKVALAWDTTRLYLALADLVHDNVYVDSRNDTLSPERHATQGKPIKLYQADVIPGDCPSSSISAVSLSFPSPMCALTHIHVGLDTTTGLPPLSCMHKCFSHGVDFVETDLGNHQLMTLWTIQHVEDEKKRLPLKSQRDLYNRMHMCDKVDGVDAWFDRSSLLLLHVQKLEFADWLLHYTRGASVHGFTKVGYNCTGKSVARHYCSQWQEFVHYNFSLNDLRTIYTSRFCPNVDTATTNRDDDPNMIPIAHVLAHGC